MIYFIQSGKAGPIKIGFTANDVNERLSALQAATPEKLQILMTKEGGKRLESQLHKKFDSLNIRREWFQPGEILVEFIASQKGIKRPIPVKIGESLDLVKYIEEIEVDIIRQALKNCGGNRRVAAKTLRLTYRSFRYKLKKYEI